MSKVAGRFNERTFHSVILLRAYYAVPGPSLDPREKVEPYRASPCPGDSDHQWWALLRIFSFLSSYPSSSVCPWPALTPPGAQFSHP